VVDIGSSLREARLRQGLELADAADAIKVRARFLEALESDRFELLPEGPYLRSFLREYAEYLGLDGDILVTELMLHFAPHELEAPEPPRRRGMSRLPQVRVVLVVVALAAVGAGVWRLGRSNPTTVRAPLHALATPSKAAAAATRHVVTHRRVSAQQPAHATLVLTAAGGPCWLLVRRGSATGQPVEEATLQQGQTLRFGLRHPLWIRIGAPWNLAASIGGRQVTASLPTAIGNVVVSARGLQPAP
jgi:cytoskeletal protein RodZ